jgi:ABC-type phosphate transport system permease subunit
VVAGFALGVVEVLLPGYIFLGFAVGAVLTGVLVGLGVIGGTVAPLVFAFALMSLIAWFCLRRVFGVHQGAVKIWDRDVND